MHVSKEGTQRLEVFLHVLPKSEHVLLKDSAFKIRYLEQLQYELSSPLVHQSIGTFPEGTVRVSVGFFNTGEEIDELLEALDRIRSMKAT